MPQRPAPPRSAAFASSFAHRSPGLNVQDYFMNTASLFHIGSGFVSLVIGFVVLGMRKGTRKHRWFGWLYVVLMATSLLAILYRTRATPPPFAGYAVFVLFVLIAAIASSRRRTTLRSWRGWHAGLMLLTLLGSIMAATSIGAGVMSGASSGPVFYQLFNAIIVVFTGIALTLVWRNRTVWGTRLDDGDLAARRKYAVIVSASSLALVFAQWSLAFP